MGKRNCRVTRGGAKSLPFPHRAPHDRVMLGKMSVALALASLLVAPLSGAHAEAAEPCAAAATPRSAQIGAYTAIFERCARDDGDARLATRRWRAGGQSMLLLVDPQSLATQVAPAQCWRCAPTGDAEEAATRFAQAVQGQGKTPETPKALENAGLVHGQGAGVFVTGDLCPSRRPLDRGFLELLAKEGAGTPVALAVSGLWLARHADDLDWLRRQADSGALTIAWVNHSYRHPYLRRLPDERTFLLTPGVDMDAEIFKTEKLLLENGLTPSVFFRFPGLVSDAALMEKLRARHLVALGADSWLALGPRPREGSIVLVHPNGNEPVGLAIFARLLERGRIPKPLRRIEEAPR